MVHLPKAKKEFKNTRDSGNIHRNELDKVCFQYDMAYGDFNNLARRTTFDKVKHLILLKIQI